MAEYTVASGDTLYGIARRFHIHYWPNLYFATGNEEFRRTRSPDLIYPGDHLVIPALDDIRPMERRPLIVYRRVPLFAQAPETCWRATAKMLYMRKKAGVPGAEAEFTRLIGPEYAAKTDGLRSEHWQDFYVRRLLMKEARIVSQNDLHYIVAVHGPAVVMLLGEGSGHAVVLAGYDLFRGRWFVLNPAAGISLEFEADEISVGGGSSSSASDGEARLTGYTSGAATYENMGAWIWMMDTQIEARVYYYE